MKKTYQHTFKNGAVAVMHLEHVPGEPTHTKVEWLKGPECANTEEYDDWLLTFEHDLLQIPEEEKHKWVIVDFVMGPGRKLSFLVPRAHMKR